MPLTATPKAAAMAVYRATNASALALLRGIPPSLVIALNAWAVSAWLKATILINSQPEWLFRRQHQQLQGPQQQQPPRRRAAGTERGATNDINRTDLQQGPDVHVQNNNNTTIPTNEGFIGPQLPDNINNNNVRNTILANNTRDKELRSIATYYLMTSYLVLRLVRLATAFAQRGRGGAGTTTTATTTGRHQPYGDFFRHIRPLLLQIGFFSLGTMLFDELVIFGLLRHFSRQQRKQKKVLQKQRQLVMTGKSVKPEMGLTDDDCCICYGALLDRLPSDEDEEEHDEDADDESDDDDRHTRQHQYHRQARGRGGGYPGKRLSRKQLEREKIEAIDGVLENFCRVPHHVAHRGCMTRWWNDGPKGYRPMDEAFRMLNWTTGALQETLHGTFQMMTLGVRGPAFAIAGIATGTTTTVTTTGATRVGFGVHGGTGLAWLLSTLPMRNGEDGNDVDGDIARMVRLQEQVAESDGGIVGDGGDTLQGEVGQSFRELSAIADSGSVSSPQTDTQNAPQATTTTSSSTTGQATTTTTTTTNPEREAGGVPGTHNRAPSVVGSRSCPACRQPLIFKLVDHSPQQPYPDQRTSKKKLLTARIQKRIRDYCRGFVRDLKKFSDWRGLLLRSLMTLGWVGVTIVGGKLRIQAADRKRLLAQQNRGLGTASAVLAVGSAVATVATAASIAASGSGGDNSI